MKHAIVILSLSLFVISWNKNVQALKHEHIVGGYFANPGEFTYQVHLSVGCGGSIIGPSHVVTAAHCIINDEGDFLDGRIIVTAGTNNLKEKEHAPTTVVAIVNKMYVPDKFPRPPIFPLYGDVAILRVTITYDLSPSSYLKPLELPPIHKDYSDFSHKTVIVTGFGTDLLRFKPYYDESNNLVAEEYRSKKMSYAKAIVLQDNYCKVLVGDMFVSSFHICAVVQQTASKPHCAPSGTCYGDSGAPLVYDGKYIIGVLSSSSYACDDTKSAAIYTSTIHFRSFIEAAVANKCENMYCLEFDY